METLKMLISSQELSTQEEVLQALAKEGFQLTQATLSRDLKQLKVAKAASMNGKYVYVLPNETMYKRITNPMTAQEMLRTPGFLSINFSGNMAVIKTRPGYASSIAYIDQYGCRASLSYYVSLYGKFITFYVSLFQLNNWCRRIFIVVATRSETNSHYTHESQ